jgi:hypothetical protein
MTREHGDDSAFGACHSCRIGISIPQSIATIAQERFMVMKSVSTALSPFVRRVCVLVLSLLALGLSACFSSLLSSGGEDLSRSKPAPASAAQAEPTVPAPPAASIVTSNERQLAYGLSITLPASYAVAGIIGPSGLSREELDSRIRGGERVLLLESAGTPSPRGIDPVIGVFLVQQEGTFMPRQYAEQMRPEDFAALSQDIFAREKAEAKKKKTAAPLELRLNRDNIGGNLAIKHHIQIKGPDGKPVELGYWDIYLPSGVGVAIRSKYDQSQPGMAEEMARIVRSLRAS